MGTGFGTCPWKWVAIKALDGGRCIRAIKRTLLWLWKRTSDARIAQTRGARTRWSSVCPLPSSALRFRSLIAIEAAHLFYGCTEGFSYDDILPDPIR